MDTEEEEIRGLKVRIARRRKPNALIGLGWQSDRFSDTAHLCLFLVSG